MKKVLTIAGSDSIGGAGIQADIKTMTANNVYAMSAITALTAQNTTGVTGIVNVAPEFVKSQLEMIFEDIFPDAIKIGMVSSPEIVEAIEYELVKYKVKNIDFNLLYNTKNQRRSKNNNFQFWQINKHQHKN